MSRCADPRQPACLGNSGLLEVPPPGHAQCTVPPDTGMSVNWLPCPPQPCADFTCNNSTSGSNPCTPLPPDPTDTGDATNTSACYPNSCIDSVTWCSLEQVAVPCGEGAAQMGALSRAGGWG